MQTPDAQTYTIYWCTHTHARTHAQMHAHAHAHTHTHKHTHTHTHTHTRAHTYQQHEDSNAGRSKQAFLLL